LQPIDLVRFVGEVFNDLDVPWVLGGSVASSLIGEPRSTVDIDVAVRLARAKLDALIADFGEEFLIDREDALRAIRQHGSFNALHYPSVLKIDIFVLGDDPLDIAQVERRRQYVVDGEQGPFVVWAGSPEDQMLRKLRWYQLGQEVSERQWRDVLGIIAVQRDRLDLSYMRELAASTGLTDLLEQALRAADKS
jgi:Nucleotidyl transferase AbiEii toxin, Type IV TA system